MCARLLTDPSWNAKAWYLWCFASFVSVGPFLNVYFERVGLNKAQVGLIGALRPWISAPASFIWAALADRLHAHRAVLLATLSASVAVRMLLLLPRSFGGLLAVVLVAEVLAAPVGVLADAAVMHICDKESDYGKYRLWGAVGWGTFSTIAGWIISHLGIRWAFYTQSVLTLPALVHGARLFTATTHSKGAAGASGRGSVAAAPLAATADYEPGDPEQERLLQHQQPQQPQVLKGPSDLGGAGRRHGSRGHDDPDRDSGQTRSDERDPEAVVPLLSPAPVRHPDAAPGVAVTAAGLAGGRAPAAGGDVAAGGEGRGGAGEGPGGEEGAGAAASARYWWRLWALLQRGDVLIFFATTLVMGYGFGTIDSFLFLYLEQMGASGTLMGLTLTITCAAEVPAFQLQDRLLDRWGVTAVLDLVQCVYALRMALYAALPLAGNVMWVLPVEVLHGITFACGWGAGTVNCKLLAPPGLAATLQGAFQGLYFGAGYGLGSLVGGWVGTKLGWQGMFACASATMLAFWVTTVIARHVMRLLTKPAVVTSLGGNYVELTPASDSAL